MTESELDILGAAYKYGTVITGHKTLGRQVYGRGAHRLVGDYLRVVRSHPTCVEMELTPDGRVAIEQILAGGMVSDE